MEGRAEMENENKQQKSPEVVGGKIKNHTYRLAPLLINVNHQPETVDIVEHALTLNIGQLRGLIKEVREEGFSYLAAQLDMVLDEKLNWGRR